MINSSAYFLLLFSEAQIALNYIGYIIVVYCSICRLYHDRGSRHHTFVLWNWLKVKERS